MDSLDSETKPLLISRDPENCLREDDPHEPRHELYGYGLVLGSGIVFATMASIIRYITGYAGIHASTIVFLRGITQSVLALCSGYCLFNRDDTLKVPRGSWTLLTLRGALGGASLAFAYSMLRRVPLGTATSVLFINPVIALLLSTTILRERINWREGFACALCFLGVLLVANPTLSTPDKFPRSYLVGVVFGLCGAFTTAAEIICARVLAGRIHFMTNVLAMGIGTFVAGIIVGGSNVPIMEKPVDISIAIFACTLGFLGQCLFNAALKFCRASTGAILRNIDVPFSYCFGLLLGEMPKLVSIIGSTLIVAGTVIVGSTAARKEAK